MKQVRLLIVLIIVVSVFAQPAVAATLFSFGVNSADFHCAIDYEGNGTIMHMNATQPMTFTRTPTSLLDLNIMEASDLRMKVNGFPSGTLRIGLRGPRGGTTLASFDINLPEFVMLNLTGSDRLIALSPSATDTLQSNIDLYGADKLFLAFELGVSSFFFSIASARVFSARKEIDVDVKPGDAPNTINPRSRGVIPVAILTTTEFDAGTVDITTLQFGPTGNEAVPLNAALEDVDGDGDLDLILHFQTQHTAIDCETSMVLLKGATSSGELIGGRDAVVAVGCR